MTVEVGYSLPQTDIYMQYFLKSALGPNTDLNKIFVFDPVLYNDDVKSREMKDRYACCFSPQLQKRIIFQPDSDNYQKDKGTIKYFVHEMIKGKYLFER